MAYLNLVDPISHDLLMNLARDLQCPKSVRLRNVSDRGQECPGLRAGIWPSPGLLCVALGKSPSLSRV